MRLNCFCYPENGRVSLVVPVEGSTDRFLITIGRKIAVMTWDGVSILPSKLETLVEVENEPSVAGNRFNDGKVDPVGRLWAGNIIFLLYFMKRH